MQNAVRLNKEYTNKNNVCTDIRCQYISNVISLPININIAQYNSNLKNTAKVTHSGTRSYGIIGVIGTFNIKKYKMYSNYNIINICNNIRADIHHRIYELNEIIDHYDKKLEYIKKGSFKYNKTSIKRERVIQKINKLKLIQDETIKK